MESIFFEIGKTELTPDSRKKMDTILQFILEHNGSSIRLDGYACVIGKQIDNQVLSENRSKTVKEFFIKGKLAGGRITTVGHGELNPTDDKKGRDNLKYKDEKDYINNRRVDISFEYYGHNADTIVYDTILGSKPTTITVDPVNFDTKACFSKTKHKKKLSFRTPISKMDLGQYSSYLSSIRYESRTTELYLAEVLSDQYTVFQFG
ncbi:OmpA family protein [Sphingobacterium sp. E70]|uniref:OmpA family protein n=1 Tax=Sphingobacterium sp. E70 TaxID=2853439 RepID=UPI00211B76F3|nr:OmpA family protein [Sphingobacterium sp. E70]ULT25614.1 OmpA family protein [Sphingobacterium sp. E70]